jgi:hypothetical protein
LNVPQKSESQDEQIEWSVLMGEKAITSTELSVFSKAGTINPLTASMVQ